MSEVMAYATKVGLRNSVQPQTPIQVQVEYTDGLWVYRNEALNLWGCGERREDALSDLHANFAYLWQEFAEEEDSVLDSKALALKHRLLDLQSNSPSTR